jgi:microcystin-dependent protein
VGYVTGDLKPWPGAVLPTSGWLIADGSAVSRTNYATLFGVLGTVWGDGDGASTFNLPDLRGRTLVGAGAGPGLTARTLGQSGGAEGAVIGSANLPAHTHPIADPGHAHTISDPGHSHTASVAASTVTGGTGAGGAASGSTGSAVTGITGTQTASTGITATLANTGGGTALPTLPPFAVLNWIIKT